MNKFFTLLFLLGVLTFSFGGCYTILIHPDSGEGYTSRDYQDACVDCHTDYNDYPYGYFYGDHYPDYWWSTPRFGHYYAYPWWWDYYWSPSEGYYGEDGGNNDTFVPRSSTGEKATRRNSGSMRPPYVQDQDMPTIPNITRGGSSGGSRGTTTKETTGNAESGSDSNQDNSSGKQTTKEDNTKKTRRGGGRK